MYKYRQFGRQYAVSIDNHEEIASALQAFCKAQDIQAGAVYGIGAVSRMTLRFLDPQTKQYVDHEFREQMEVANLTGNISRKDGEVYLHLHATGCRSDCTCIGGHLLSAEVNGACELAVEPWDGPMGRRFDPETGLNLYEL